MENVGALKKEKISAIGQFLLILGGLMVVPMFPNQLFSGPLVNALLFIVTVFLGLRSGIILSFVPSLMALFGGLLPAIMAPFIPFIIISNIIMVVLFHYVRRKNYWLGVGAGGVVKFLFLTVSIQLYFQLFLNKPITQAIVTMMSWNQLYSALMGGVIAFVFLKFVKRI
ncbi:MAG: iron hydrogenase [Candidatus Magasanikbacteria bacterium CG10_big_fil_rev_8_21_14_0_10_36_32]|uniref:Iron hydrogenase n=1 Tax=Candidatus Magasanikbacteria bacterium CG10_big_fil_rev_8_21_14_0_10_36_32 TaxID=1974646 RepID=A0A2M6W5K2_9BACT|nr:MAG: iron hydrogenase [Candidatus Magasanikbacteria bacterium CG10_big_fil_rev_8_21_14_0_10_36_32]